MRQSSSFLSDISQPPHLVQGENLKSSTRSRKAMCLGVFQRSFKPRSATLPIIQLREKRSRSTG
jgi:hypothetical protein